MQRDSRIEPWLLGYVPDDLKTQEMCNKAVDHCPLTLRFVSNHLKTKKMCERAVEVEPEAL